MVVEGLSINMSFAASFPLMYTPFQELWLRKILAKAVTFQS